MSLDDLIARARTAGVRPAHAERYVARLRWWTRASDDRASARRSLVPYLAGAGALAAAALAAVIVLALRPDVAGDPANGPATGGRIDPANGPLVGRPVDLAADARATAPALPAWARDVAAPTHVAPSPTTIAPSPTAVAGAPTDSARAPARSSDRRTTLSANRTDLTERRTASSANRTDVPEVRVDARRGGEPAERWRAARALRAEGHFEAALAACVALADARDPTWSPIALVEAVRIAGGPLGAADRAVALADRFAAEWAGHALAGEVSALRCRALGGGCAISGGTAARP